MHLLQYLDPLPAHPPSYTSSNCSGSLARFPVYETPESHVLPNYSPAVTGLTLVLRKVECLSPYEASPYRSWKNLIMELNSTQVNFYTVDGLPLLNRVKVSKGKNNFMFNSIEREFIISSIKGNPEKYLTQERLVRSYTLQYAAFGLPIDYKKRNYCLRLRLETEQMIVQFANLDEMINWANNLSTGINVSLSLDNREMPTDKTVPRRRRNRRNRNGTNRIRSYSDTELIRRELSPPILGGSSFIHPSSMVKRASVSGETTKKLFSKIFGRSRSSSNVSPPSSSSVNKSSPLFQNHIEFEESDESPPLSIRTQDSEATQVPEEESLEESQEEFQEEFQEEEEEEDDDDDDDLEDDELNESEITEDLISPDEEIPDNEINSIHGMNDVDSDDDSLHETTRTNSGPDVSTPLFREISFSKSLSSEPEKSWKPDYKIISRKKYYKDCIRCIKILTSEESWCGRPLVRSISGPTGRNINDPCKRSPMNRYVKEFVVGYNGLVAV